MSFSVEAEERVLIGKAVNELRQAGRIPAVVYGYGFTNRNIAVSYTAFERLLRQGGASTLVDLKINNESVKALVHDVQRDPISDRVIHVDFHQVTLTEKINAVVPLSFTGRSAAVKELGGTLVHNLSEVHVRCLPEQLIAKLEVDVTCLATFEDMITVRGLLAPAGVEILDSISTVVAKVTPPLSEEQLKKMESASADVDVSKIEKVESKKKEEVVAE